MLFSYDSEQYIVAKGSFVLSLSNSDSEGAITALDDLKKMYELPSEQELFECDVYKEMVLRVDLEVENLNFTHEQGRVLVNEVLASSNYSSASSTFFAKFYDLSYQMRSTSNSVILQDMLDIEINCPVHYKRNFYLMLIVVCDSIAGAATLERAITAYKGAV
jgi:hypothetical protein